MEALLLESLFYGDTDGPCSASSPSQQASVNAHIWKWINILQGYSLEIHHIPGKRNPIDILSRQDKKDALGRKIAVHDANTDLVNELDVPSGADHSATHEALVKLFNAQVRNQTESAAVEGQASREKEISWISGPQGIRFSRRSVQSRSARVKVQESKSSLVQAKFISIKQ